MNPKPDQQKKIKRKPISTKTIRIPKPRIINKNINNDPNQSSHELKHEDCVWAFELCIDDNFAKTFMCSECNNIPKTGSAYTCSSGFIFCEYCIDLIISTQSPAKIHKKQIQQKIVGKVIDNLVKTLKIRCPHCKKSQINQLQQQNDNKNDNVNINNNIPQQKSHELKQDEELDDIDDDNSINIPPFPTSIQLNQQRHHSINLMYNEGVDDNQLGIVGINNINEPPDKPKKDNEYYCDWTGTIGELNEHLLNDCKFIKMNCPLHDLDSTLCDVTGLYQHQLKHHLESFSVNHWQQIVKQISELKSMQLSIVLKNEYINEDNVGIGFDNNNTPTPHNPIPNNNNNYGRLKELIERKSADINKLSVEYNEYKLLMNKQVNDIQQRLKIKDALLSQQNNQFQMMSKEITYLKKQIKQINNNYDNKHNYESNITSMFNHNINNNNNSHQKMLEIQQILLQTQNRIDNITNEMKIKDNLINSQNKSISNLQSQISVMQPQPTCHTTHTTQMQHTSPSISPQQMQIQQPGSNTIRTHNRSSYGHINTLPPIQDHIHSSSVPGYMSPPSQIHSQLFDQAQLHHSFSTSEPAIVQRKRCYGYPSGHKQHHTRRNTNRSYHDITPGHTYQDKKIQMQRLATGSKSLSHIQLNDLQPIYRTDSSGSNDLDDNLIQLPHDPTSLPKRKRRSINIHNTSAFSDQKMNNNPPRILLYGVGYNEEGEIGLGHRSNLNKFTRLSFCDNMYITSVYYGSQSFFYLTLHNELYCCGYNKYGQLGLGHTTEYIIKPTLNKYFKHNRSIDFISNSVCAYHTIIMLKSGKLYGFGWNNNGQLGIGNKSFKESVPIELKSDIFKNQNIISISCGFHHTLFLTENGNVICCGNNQYGQTGFGSNVSEVISPEFIDNNILRNIISIKCGEYYSCCLNKNGSVLTMGRNDSGQLGLGSDIKTSDCIYIPTVISYFRQNGIIITNIECGDYHTLCLNSKGEVYAYGNNEYGQIGSVNNKYDSFINIPTKCILPNNNKSKVIIDIDVGAYHSLLLSEDNQLYSFGNNDCNQCSTQINIKKINTPYWVKKKNEIKYLDDDNNNKNNHIVQIIAGYDTTFIVTNEYN